MICWSDGTFFFFPITISWLCVVIIQCFFFRLACSRSMYWWKRLFFLKLGCTSPVFESVIVPIASLYHSGTLPLFSALLGLTCCVQVRLLLPFSFRSCPMNIILF